MPVFLFPSLPQKPQFPQWGGVRLVSYSCNTPSECCPFIKTFSYICRSGGFCRLILHIVKVFFASPFVKMWKFSYLKDSTEQHSLRVDTWDRCILHLDTPYLLRCGVLCRLFQIGSFHNLHEDKRKSAPHFLCIYPNIRSPGHLG